MQSTCAGEDRRVRELKQKERPWTKTVSKRERAQEEGYFRAQDAKLIEKLREDARLEEIVLALAEQLQVNNPELLRRVIALGVTLDTGPAFLLTPLVQVAWAEGKVTDRERETVLRLAAPAASRPARRPTLSSSSGSRSVRRMLSSTRPWRSSEAGSPSFRRSNEKSASSASCRPAMRWQRRPAASPRCLALGAVCPAKRKACSRLLPPRSGG